MEGYLSVPPDRGTILGRAVWKTRYVVVGSTIREGHAGDFASHTTSSSHSKDGRSSSRSQPAKFLNGPMYLSVYKNPDDRDPIQQFAVSNITDCQVQLIAHRRQGPVLPTLVVNMVPDHTTDKLRKRRSSRAAGLVASVRESSSSTLWFRPAADEHERERYSLHDWMRFIQAVTQPNIPDRVPMSPMSPLSPTFVNPFASRQPRDDLFQSPLSSANYRAPLQRKASAQTCTARERPATYSDSQSLRSRRSDISSQTGPLGLPHVVPQTYTSILPADLPSPATTIGEYQGGFIEGWTSAQGRSSTLSSPVRARDSVGSMPPMSPQPLMDPGSPPMIPRESILDRAFQLHCIPGSENELPGEEKLSSLARFDALMAQAESKKKQREQQEQARKQALPPTPKQDEGLKSAWDVDDDSDEDSDTEDSDDHDGYDNFAIAGERDLDEVIIRPEAQKALDYIIGRRAHQPAPRMQGRRSQIGHNPETLMALNSGSSLRPQTAYGRHRPGFAQRTHSQPYIAGIASWNSDAASGGIAPAEDGSLNAMTALQRTTSEKRQSGSSSVKRLSFTEFTKRLSSTSSLLLVQTNQSGGSSFQSETESQPQLNQLTVRRSHQTRVPPPLPPERPREPEDKKCGGWRGSVGVLSEGGFL